MNLPAPIGDSPYGRNSEVGRLTSEPAPSSSSEDLRLPVSDRRDHLPVLDAIARFQQFVRDCNNLNSHDAAVARREFIDAVQPFNDLSAVADVLIEILPGSIEFQRSAIRMGLFGTANARAESALLLDTILDRKARQGLTISFGQPAREESGAAEEQQQLRLMANDPLLFSAMLRYLTHQCRGDEMVAQALRESSLPEAQASVRGALIPLVPDQLDVLVREEAVSLPLALDASDPRSREFLVMLLTTRRTSSQLFEQSVIRALSAVPNEAVSAALATILYSPESSGWNARSREAALEGLKAGLNQARIEEAELLVQPSLWGAESALVTIEGRSGLGRLGRRLSLQLLESGRRHLFDMRVYAAALLSERNPAAAARVFNEALNGEGLECTSDRSPCSLIGFVSAVQAVQTQQSPDESGADPG